MSDNVTIVATERLPVSVLTGFLGSGKTTLLRELLKQSDMAKTAVIINEFGEIGLDHLLVEKGDEDIVLMSSGCLCCTIRGDLIDTLRNLFVRRVKGEIPDFDRVVIETTGLADPAPILHTLMADPLIAARFRLDSVVTTVDAVHGASELDANPESVKQAAVADRLVLTKTDIADPATTQALKLRLRSLNPAAAVEPAVLGRIAANKLFNAGLYDPRTKSADVQRWLNEEAFGVRPHGHEHHDGHDHEHHDGHDHEFHDGHGHEHHGGHEHGQRHADDHAHDLDVNRHDDHIRSFCLTYDKPFAWPVIAESLDLLAQTHGQQLLRVKGILHVEEEPKPVVIHGVQHMFHPPVTLPTWPDDDRRSKIVFITRDLDRDYIAKSLDALFASCAAA
jgi:G3E family GTPase